ncbi:MAG: type II methionyl aminopeptidase [Candidatus Heimdallarchaeota archaeon]
MDEDWKKSYIKAGKAVIAAKKLAQKIVKPGLLFLDLATKCEDEILNQGCKLAFPINISLNEIAAHYSPTIDDEKIIPAKGLLKIDLGAHYEGYIADSAFTININNDKVLKNYIDAAVESLEAAIAKFKPGTKLYELGEVIADKIINHGLRPIVNLGGHELKRYNLHAGPFIPNFRDTSHNQILKIGDSYACEPFATSGVGKVMNGNESYIYRFVRKAKKDMSYKDLDIMKKIENITQRLPFSPRLLEKNGIEKQEINNIINKFLRKKILDNYPILIERSGEPVAQQEHTIIIDMDGNPIVITREE